MSLKELLAQREALAFQQAELAKAIAETQATTRAAAITEIKSLLKEHGLSVADLTEVTTKRAPTKDGSRAGSKVAAKFRNPVTGDSWSGRGLTPKWLKAAVEAGKTKEDFAV